MLEGLAFPNSSPLCPLRVTLYNGPDSEPLTVEVIERHLGVQFCIDILWAVALLAPAIRSSAGFQH
jgi:hypothetical protein